MSELSHYIKLRSTICGCGVEESECDKYFDCDSCLEDRIEEHDRQIRADVIDEFKTDIINKIDFEDKWLFICKSNNADTNIMFSALKSFVENRAEQLKEQNFK